MGRVKKIEKLLGKRVAAKLDRRIVIIGKLLTFGNGGSFTIETDSGEIMHCWPLLSIEECE